MLAQEEVATLDISMNDISFMEVGNALEKLKHETLDMFDIKADVAVDDTMHIVLQILKDQVD